MKAGDHLLRWYGSLFPLHRYGVLRAGNPSITLVPHAKPYVLVRQLSLQFLQMQDETYPMASSHKAAKPNCRLNVLSSFRSERAVWSKFPDLTGLSGAAGSLLYMRWDKISSRNLKPQVSV